MVDMRMSSAIEGTAYESRSRTHHSGAPSTTSCGVESYEGCAEDNILESGGGHIEWALLACGALATLCATLNPARGKLKVLTWLTSLSP
jgi:hypothetical protein